MRAGRLVFGCCVIAMAAGPAGRGLGHAEAALSSIDANRDRYAQIARQIFPVAGAEAAPGPADLTPHRSLPGRASTR